MQAVKRQTETLSLSASNCHAHIYMKKTKQKSLFVFLSFSYFEPPYLCAVKRPKHLKAAFLNRDSANLTYTRAHEGIILRTVTEEVLPTEALFSLKKCMVHYDLVNSTEHRNWQGPEKYEL